MISIWLLLSSYKEVIGNLTIIIQKNINKLSVDKFLFGTYSGLSVFYDEVKGIDYLGE
jgi:hypothetical protein